MQQWGRSGSRRSLTLVLIGLGLGQSGPAAAQGFTIPEMGARENGMVAAIGRPDELAAIYHNPAALTSLSGTQLFLSAGSVFLRTNIRLAPWTGSDTMLKDPVDSDGYYPEVNPSVFAVVPMLGVSTNLWSEKVVGAFALYVPNAAGATFDEDAVTRYHMIDAYVVAGFATFAAAYRPWPWLSVGGGVSVVYIRIHRRYKLYPYFNGLNFTGFFGKDTEIDIEGEDVQPAFHFGLQAWPHRTLSLGFMMLSRYDVTLEGPLTLKPGAGALPQVKTREFTENEQSTTIIAPWILAFGANWDVLPWLEIGGEFRYYLNSLVDEQVTEITSGKLATVLPDGRLVTPKNYHDSFHTGGGFNIKPPLPIQLEIMTGVSYDNSFAPDNTVEVGTPSFNLCAYHVGARWRINERFRVSLFYAHYWYLERTVKDSIISPTTNFTGSGMSDMVTLVLEGRIARGIGVRTP